MEELEKKREAARLRFKQKNEERQKTEDNNHTFPLEPISEPTVTPASDDGSLPEPDNSNAESETKSHCFIAFARVFSGTLRVGQKVYVLGPKYDPSTVYDTDAVSF